MFPWCARRYSHPHRTHLAIDDHPVYHLQAMLINSANLMGGSSEPDGSRRFGRVHLEAGLPLKGSGDMALFVQDAARRHIEENTVDDYYFNLASGTGVELRATIAWIDPPTARGAKVQLVHDLDLEIVSPNGTQHRMWGTRADKRNVIECVIVPAEDVDLDNAGDWIIQVSSRSLTTASQPYSLVVSGPIAEDTIRILQATENTIRNLKATLLRVVQVLLITLALRRWLLLR